MRSDLESDRQTSSEERAFGHGFRSLCSLPLVVRGKNTGAITVGSLTKFQYTEADAPFLMDVANQIAIAVDNMMAHEETEALKARFQAETVYLQEEIKTEHNFEEIIGQSAPLQQLLRKLEQVAPTDTTVLIHEAPRLRERKKDIPLLVNFFLSKFGKKLGKEARGVSQRSMDSLIAYDWPGNIRELENMIERTVVLANGPIVQVDDSVMRSERAAEETGLESLEDVERNHIVRALKQTNWVIHGKNGAAQILGINPSTLRSRMEKLGIKKS